MATQVIVKAASTVGQGGAGPFDTGGFTISPQDSRLNPSGQNFPFVGAPGPGSGPTVPAASPGPTTSAPLGVLADFTGTFAGAGFNTIFRPSPAKAGLGDNILELNLTKETLSFSSPLGDVPNRGTGSQDDVFLNGVPYIQSISDVTNSATGKADNTPSGVHFEPGLWMHVPASTVPQQGESLSRMASIPHGTTINAQCLTSPKVTSGPPTIPAVDITPFLIGSTNKISFPSQNAGQTSNIRLPSDLSKFIAAGTITQAILSNPNSVLSNANIGQNIVQTTEFTVATGNQGTGNIDFLQGGDAPNQNQNANAVQMVSTFWVEQVQYTIPVKAAPAGNHAVVSPQKPNPNAQVPIFLVSPPHEIKQDTTIKVTSTQIQYSQTVFLNFAGLSWPHVSCATLVPSRPVVVPASAFTA